MLNLNDVKIAGNLTRDPQVRFLQNEKAVAEFSIAINRTYSHNGESKQETTFVEVVAWGRQAELVGQYLTKGRNCLVEGSLKFEQWTDKQNNKRSILKVTANRVHFIGSENKPEKSTQKNQEPDYYPPEEEPPF